MNAPADKENSLLISELSGILTASDDPALRLKPDYKFYISYDFYPVDNTNFQYAPSYGHFKFPQNQRILTPQMNHISMDFPPFALLTDLGRSRKLQFCNGSSVSMKCRFEYCECIHVLQVPLNAVVEIILIDEGNYNLQNFYCIKTNLILNLYKCILLIVGLPYNANHPFHLHGYKFKVLGMDRLGNSTTEEIVRNLDKEGLLKRNFDNPPIKDTITTPDGGYTILRFQATNPGTVSSYF